MHRYHPVIFQICSKRITWLMVRTLTHSFTNLFNMCITVALLNIKVEEVIQMCHLFSLSCYRKEALQSSFRMGTDFLVFFSKTAFMLCSHSPQVLLSSLLWLLTHSLWFLFPKPYFKCKHQISILAAHLCCSMY